MTTTINASTSSGLVQTADTSGILQLQTANTAAMTIDASQNVGIGTASPAVTLDVGPASGTTTNSVIRINGGGTAGYGPQLRFASAGTLNGTIGTDQSILGGTSSDLSVYIGTATNFRVYTNATERMRITSAGLVQVLSSSTSSTFTGSGELALKNSTSNPYISWHGDTGTRYGYVQGSSSNLAIQSETGYLSLAGSGGEGIRINANKNVVLSGGTTSANGIGITFPATQSASSDANCLDDYEEGTWTPSVQGNATYTQQYGTYVKVGKMVTVNFDIAINTIGTGSNTTIYGFPFTSSNDGFPRTGCVSYYANLSVAPIFIAFYVANNSTSCVFVWNTAGSATVGNNAGNLFTSSSRIIGSVTYSASA